MTQPPEVPQGPYVKSDVFRKLAEIQHKTGIANVNDIITDLFELYESLMHAIERNPHKVQLHLVGDVTEFVTVPSLEAYRKRVAAESCLS